MTERDTTPARPVLIDLDPATPARPQDAAPVPDVGLDHMPASGAAMQRAAVLAARRRSPLAAWFWSLAAALTSFVAGLALWDYVAGLLARSPVLGAVAGGLAALLVLTLALLSLRELAAIGRLARLDRLQKAAGQALLAGDLTAARAVTGQVLALYAARPELAPGRDRLTRALPEVLDADGLIGLADTALLTPLDQQALAKVQNAARTVAAVTAVVPLPLADVAAALLSNLRMIRAIAEIYGGRAGVLGSWRLARAVLTHLVATGAVAVGDDLISSVAGGGLLSKLSRRFGEGVVNGALTARVGIATMEVCRPLPFRPGAQPSVTGILSRALRGLFGSDAPTSP